MNCADCREKLIFIIQQEMELAETIPYHEHLANCDECLQEYQELFETIDFVSSGLSNSNEEGMDEKQLENIHNALKSNKNSIKFPFWIYSVAASLVLTFILITVLNKGKGEQNIAAIPTAKEEKKLTDSSTDEKALKEVKVKSIQKMDNTVESLPLVDSSNRLNENSTNSIPIPAASNEEKAIDKAGAVAEENDFFSKSSAKTEKNSFSLQEMKNLIKDAFAAEEFDKSTQLILLQLIENNNWSITTQADKELDDKKRSLTKILVKKIKNNKNSIDFAYIFVHNGKIVRIEPIKSN